MTAVVSRRGNHRAASRGGVAGDDAERLFAKVDELLAAVHMPRSLAQVGIGRDEFERALPDLTRAAFEDPSLRTNPHMPLLHELTGLLEAGYSRD